MSFAGVGWKEEFCGLWALAPLYRAATPFQEFHSFHSALLALIVEERQEAMKETSQRFLFSLKLAEWGMERDEDNWAWNERWMNGITPGAKSYNQQPRNLNSLNSMKRAGAANHSFHFISWREVNWTRRKDKIFSLL